MLAALLSVISSLAPSPAPDAAEAEGSTDNLSDPFAEAAQPEPAPEPAPAPEPGPSGGFGQVGEVAVDSQVQAPPPPDPDASLEDDEQPRLELTGRAEIGFAQTHVGNADGLDHNGLFLRAHLVVFPWISERRVIGAGFGGAYSYAGLNRAIDPELGFMQRDSSAQQQIISLSFDVLLRPHRDWFAIHLSPMVGLGWYGNAELLVLDRPAEVANDDYGFATGGTLALCTAWAIACVTGGSQIVFGVQSRALEADELEPRSLNPWGWHLALGVDIARIVMRANRVTR